MAISFFKIALISTETKEAIRGMSIAPLIGLTQIAGGGD
jgi:hypothetical protein